MADTPLPPQITPSSDALPAAPVLPVRDGIVPVGTNGIAARPDRGDRDHLRGAPAGPTLGEWLMGKASYAAILAGLWIVAVIALSLYGFQRAEALGFATLFTLVAAFFVRTLFPLAQEKVQAAATEKHHGSTDSFREIIDTVVFVVVLVLMLKSFSAEAFVIPTGSMAPTLWGYQKVIKCPECGHEFPVNCSSQVDPTEGKPQYVGECTCPNCRKEIVLIPPQSEGSRAPAGANLADPGWKSGDRVLVAKFVYDLLRKLPDRLDVVVFKFPGDSTFPIDSGPVKKHVPMNYIKRLIGLPGETIAVHRGKVFVLSADKGLRYDDFEKAAGDPNKLAQLWQFEYMHHDDDRAKERWKNNEFAIVRKTPEVMLAMMRLVYDNDHQATDLKGSEYQRWRPGKSTWSASGATAFAQAGSDGEMQWLRYQHILRNSPGKPQLITDFTGYNTGHRWREEDRNWATDLAVECQVEVKNTEGTFALELSRGPNRYQASFDVATGICTLYRFDDVDGGKKPAKLDSKPSRLKGKGTYAVRFANIDDRLTVWVDDKLVFGDGVLYDQKDGFAPLKENDLDRPVSIGSQGANVVVSKLKVLRDTYYTTNQNRRPDSPDVEGFRADDPLTWKHFADAPVSTYYIQPDHFLCMGDNSPESSDGRSWGLVPKRLLLGRALLVYYPFARAGRIR